MWVRAPHPSQKLAGINAALDHFRSRKRRHSAGDALLGQLGSLLKSKIRWRDTLARLGGDEFGVLLESCSLDEARQTAEALRVLHEAYTALDMPELAEDALRVIVTPDMQEESVENLEFVIDEENGTVTMYWEKLVLPISVAGACIGEDPQ